VLARSIMGLINDAEAERRGSVRFRGEELLHRRDRQMRSIWGRSMAMVFQDPMGSLNPLMRVGDQISEPLRVHIGMSRGEAQATAEKLLADVRIPEPARRMRQYPHELSGGTRQRVMIAIALACGPELLFADEPTVGLDVVAKLSVRTFLAELNRDLGTTIVLTSHDMNDVAALCERVAVINHGVVKFDGDLSALRTQVRPTKQVTLTFENPVLDSARTAATQAALELTWQPTDDPRLVTLEVARDFLPRLLEVAATWGQLVDVEVVEADLDHVMAAMFTDDGAPS
jgi:ABC-type dipeptide/oligopeptide/nickel transport system ATPase component